MSLNSIFTQPLNNYDFLSLMNLPIKTEHQHPIIFCFTPERKKNGQGWSCNKCFSRYSYKTPSFYCTLCDYDLCQNCLAKYKLNQIQINIINSDIIQNPNNKFKWQKIFTEHMHFLTLIQKANKNKKWKCNKCLKDFTSNDSSFYCSLCDFYICKDCMNKNKGNNMNNMNNTNLNYDIEDPYGNIQ